MYNRTHTHARTRTRLHKCTRKLNHTHTHTQTHEYHFCRRQARGRRVVYMDDSDLYGILSFTHTQHTYVYVYVHIFIFTCTCVLSSLPLHTSPKSSSTQISTPQQQLWAHRWCFCAAYLLLRLSPLGTWTSRPICRPFKFYNVYDLQSLFDCDPIRSPAPETIYEKRPWIEVVQCLLTFFERYCHLYILYLLRQCASCCTMVTCGIAVSLSFCRKFEDLLQSSATRYDLAPQGVAHGPLGCDCVRPSTWRRVIDVSCT